MNDQSNNQNRNSNNQRRHHHKRRHHHNKTQSDHSSLPTAQSQTSDSGQHGHHNRRRFHRQNHNRPRPAHGQPGQQQNPPINLDRIYEKYLNLLDQHLIARRKYHDLFYRADPAQKAKLEKNFYHSLNELNDFKDKLAPAARELFEKRNNGLHLDLTYTTNHQLPEQSQAVANDGEVEDPHFLQSQKNADYSGDNEESVGTMDDYLRYKNQH